MKAAGIVLVLVVVCVGCLMEFAPEVTPLPADIGEYAPLAGYGEMSIPSDNPMTPEKVAKTVRRAVERGSYRIILPWQAAVFMRFKEIFPRTAHWMMRTTSRMLEGRIR